MTDAISAGELTDLHRKLQDDYEAAKKAFEDAVLTKQLKSDELVRFRRKYGKVLKLLEEV